MDIQKLIDEYTAWLKSEITFERQGEYFEITTPYLDNANDYLQIYVKQEDGELFLTDDSTTIHGLKMSGFQLTSTRKEHLNKVLFQYGVKLDGEQLIAKVPINGFAQKKHMFVQAMLRIDDMFVMSKPRVTSYFLEDVQTFFASQEIYCSESIQMVGKSGFSHNYDFLFQRDKNRPERLCQAVNSPNKSTAGNIIFSWNDTKPSRKEDSQLIVLLNDENNIAKTVDDAFLNYDIKVVRWSERTKNESLKLFVS